MYSGQYTITLPSRVVAENTGKENPRRHITINKIFILYRLRPDHNAPYFTTRFIFDQYFKNMTDLGNDIGIMRD